VTPLKVVKDAMKNRKHEKSVVAKIAVLIRTAFKYREIQRNICDEYNEEQWIIQSG
jgi:hypothetical protein